MSAAENSIRADLEAAMKAHAEPEEQASVANNTNDAGVGAANDVSDPERAISNDSGRADRARDDKGRFVARGDAVDSAQRDSGGSAAPPAAATPTKPEDAPPDGAAQSAASSALAPPNGWSAEAKAKWHELPPEIMAAVQKREQDVAKFTSTRDEHASFGKEMFQAVQPYLPTIRSQGGTPRTVVENMLQTAHVLHTGSPDQKRTLLLQVARDFGVELATQAPTGQQHTGQQVAPEFQRLQQEISELRSALTRGEQEKLSRLQSEVQSEIEAFAADPKHQHYPEVKAHMAALLREGVAKDLQDAYDQATWARPDLRATLLATQRAEEEQKRRDEAKRKAEEARRKSISLTGGPGNTAAQAAPGGRSLREELEANFAASSGAV